jgi:hypothetical protein
MRLEHRFVEAAPQTLEPGVLYVSIRHKSVLHTCACGCGSEVVTPLAPHRWQLSFDGETVSLEPSVGNSALPCRSHYFITKGEVDWRRPMTDRDVAWARRRDQRAVGAAFGSAAQAEEAEERTGIDLETAGAGHSPSSAEQDLGEGPRSETAMAQDSVAARGGWWRRVRGRFRR